MKMLSIDEVTINISNLKKEHSCPWVNCTYKGTLDTFIHSVAHTDYSGAWCPACERSVQVNDKGELEEF